MAYIAPRPKEDTDKASAELIRHQAYLLRRQGEMITHTIERNKEAHDAIDILIEEKKRLMKAVENLEKCLKREKSWFGRMSSILFFIDKK